VVIEIFFLVNIGLFIAYKKVGECC
jgi:hypothetical protein